MLDGDHATSGEAPSVARTIHLIQNRNLGIAGAQKIGVKRMADPRRLDGADGSRQRLAQHLAAKDALMPRLGAEAAKNILFDLLQIEEAQHFVQCRSGGFAHRFNQACFDAFANPSRKWPMPFIEVIQRPAVSRKNAKRQDMANLLLERAAHQTAAATPRGVLERLFTLMFQGFVYNQIWEDPGVDLDALALAPKASRSTPGS